MPTPPPHPGIQRQLEDIINRPALHIGISSGVLRRFWMLFYTLCEFCWGSFLGLTAYVAFPLTHNVLSDIRRYLSAEERMIPSVQSDAWNEYLLLLIIAYFIAVPLGTWGWIGSMRSYFYHRQWSQYAPSIRLLPAVLIQSTSLMILTCAISLAAHQLTASHAEAEILTACPFCPALLFSLCAAAILLLQYVRFRLIRRSK